MRTGTSFQSRNRDAFRFKYPLPQNRGVGQLSSFNLGIEMLFVSSHEKLSRVDTLLQSFNLGIEMLFVSSALSMTRGVAEYPSRFNLGIEMLFVSSVDGFTKCEHYVLDSFNLGIEMLFVSRFTALCPNAFKAIEFQSRNRDAFRFKLLSAA